jgi:hypothetical protein
MLWLWGEGTRGSFLPERTKAKPKRVITPFTFALINIPASGASLCTPTEPEVLSDVTGVVSVLP